MRKPNNQRWQASLLASIATIILLGAFGATFAQDKTEYPKPDFKEMEQWFEVQKYEYKILNQRLNIVVKAKANREDRPHYFNIDFYDGDGVRVISTNYITEEYVAETGQIEKIWAFTPSESQMKKVKSVVITRVVN